MGQSEDSNMRQLTDLAVKRLADSLSRDDPDDQLLSFGHQFFKKWYLSEPSQACLFVFKKNLRITNIQFAELLSLLRVHSTSPLFNPIESLHFISPDDFRSMAQRMSEAFQLNQKAVRDKVANLYEPIFSRTVAVEKRFGSCEVYLPRELRVDLASMCAASGYIHSCGYNIFVRKAYKSTKDELIRELKRYVKSLDNQTAEEGRIRRIYFAAYSHEDFDEYDTEERRALRDGLDELKIALEKFYMGKDRIVDVVTSVKEQETLCDLFEVARAGDSGRTRKGEVNRKKNLDRDRTVWLFVDRAVGAIDNKPSISSVSQEFRRPGDATYFMCFDQQYVNENPYHIFDENKPGWEDHTTIPHTLMGAMINITRPWWPSGSERTIVICDPFVGSGTTLLEAAKFRDVRPEGSDRSRMAPIMYRDNCEFFNAPVESLEKWESILETIDARTHFMYKDSIRSLGSREPDAVIARLLVESDGVVERLILYILLRAMRRYSTGFTRSESQEDRESLLWEAFRKEKQMLSKQIHLLVEVRRHENPRTADSGVRFTVAQGTFARSCIAICEEMSGPVIRDVKEMPEDCCDVILADPPYGFNTKEEIGDLAELYSTMVNRLILALRKDEGGQIVIAVPDWSHTGRQLPLFALKELLTQQLLIAAEKRAKSVTECPSLAMPHLSVGPYYWESERALRRAILHFIIRPNNGAARASSNSPGSV